MWKRVIGGPLIVLGLAMAVETAHAHAPYDITSYDLRIEPDLATGRIRLSAVVEISNPQHASDFVFGLSSRYDSVRVSAGNLPVRLERGADAIQATVPDAPARVSLRFDLDGDLGASPGEEKVRAVTDSSLFLLWSDRFYPLDMEDWAVMSTTLVLPAAFEVIAPGREVETRDDGPLRVHTFLTSRPVVGASVFADSRWIRTERDDRGIHMVTLLHPGSQQWADPILATSREILGFYSETYGGYPFDQFAFVTLPGIYARRAFPGFVGYDPAYLDREMKTTGHDAHETALLWWFYTVRGSGPGAYQWTEGFGDYAEFLYDERYGKPRPKIFGWFQEKYLAMDPDREPTYAELRGSSDLQPVIHGKYPMLMHVLRYRCGDPAFGRAMRLLFDRFSRRTFTMDELVSTLEEGTGASLDWWRKEWLERKGVPVLDLSHETRPRGGGYDILVRVTQQGPVYHIPVEIGIETGAGMKIETMDLGSAADTAIFRSPEEPRAVVLDPRGWILHRSPAAPSPRSGR